MTHTIITDGVSQDDNIVVGPYKMLETIKHDQTVKEDKTAQKEKGGDPNTAEKGLQNAA